MPGMMVTVPNIHRLRQVGCAMGEEGPVMPGPPGPPDRSSAEIPDSARHITATAEPITAPTLEAQPLLNKARGLTTWAALKRRQGYREVAKNRYKRSRTFLPSISKFHRRNTVFSAFDTTDRQLVTCTWWICKKIRVRFSSSFACIATLYRFEIDNEHWMQVLSRNRHAH